MIELDGIFAMKYEISPAWSEFLSAIARREPFFARELTESLVEDLFYLEEPWCGRFLELVANMATDWAWCGQRPTREEVTVWLGADLRLCHQIRELLDAWWRPKVDPPPVGDSTEL